VKRLSDLNRRQAALTLLAAGLPFGAAQAQTYPSRPIKLIVPVPPGSGVDAVSRSLGAQMSEAMGVPSSIRRCLTTRCAISRRSSTSATCPRC